MPDPATQTARVQLSPVSVGEAYAVFGASFSGPEDLRNAFQTELAAKVDELDPQKVRYDWGTFTNFDASNPQVLASWIEDNLFVKNGTKVIEAVPVPPSTVSDVYCVFTDPDTGRQIRSRVREDVDGVAVSSPGKDDGLELIVDELLGRRP